MISARRPARSLGGRVREDILDVRGSAEKFGAALSVVHRHGVDKEAALHDQA